MEANGGMLFGTFDYWEVSWVTLLGDPSESISFLS